MKHAAAPAIRLSDVSDGILRESRATADTGTFVHVEGASSADIIIRDNYLKKAKKDVTTSEDARKAVVRS